MLTNASTRPTTLPPWRCDTGRTVCVAHRTPSRFEEGCRNCKTNHRVRPFTIGRKKAARGSLRVSRGLTCMQINAIELDRPNPALVDAVLPCLVALTPEARAALGGRSEFRITAFPFRVGRESRMTTL